MSRVGAKPGLWTLDWTMDWTLDWILDWILDSIIHGPEGIQKTKLVHNKYNTHTHDQLVQAQQLARSVPLPSSDQGSDVV